MRNYYWLLLLVWLCACNKEENIDYPIVLTGEVTDVDSTGATFRARITNMKVEVLEWGFVLSENDKPSIERGDLKLPGNSSVTEGVNAVRVYISFTPGKQYFIRSYVKTNAWTIYGNETSYISLGSKATKLQQFYPTSVRLGDTLTIVGENLNYFTEIGSVAIDGNIAHVVYGVEDTLRVIIPKEIRNEHCVILLDIFGNQYSFKEKLNVKIPVIFDFYPKTVTWGDTVTLIGKNFISPAGNASLFFNDYDFTWYSPILISPTGDTIRFPISSLHTSFSTDVSVRLFNFRADAMQPLLLARMELLDFTPKVARTGARIFLKAKYFNGHFTTVKIGGYDARVDNSTDDGMEVILPLITHTQSNSRSLKIEVTSNNFTSEYRDRLTLSDPWIPLHLNSRYAYFHKIYSTGQKAYFFEGVNVYEYSEDVPTLVAKPDFPDGLFGIGFTIGSSLYYGMTEIYRGFSKDFWKLDNNTNRWVRMARFAGTARARATSISIENMGYVIGGVDVSNGDALDDVWSYNSVTNVWTEMRKMETQEELEILQYGIATFTTVGNVAYLKLNNGSSKVYKFSPNAAVRFQAVRDFPVSSNGSSFDTHLSFKLNGKPYFMVNSQNMYYYSVMDDTWVRVNETFPVNLGFGGGFVLNNKAYVSLGGQNVVWQYDPSY
jgi:hypothetical protein